MNTQKTYTSVSKRGRHRDSGLYALRSLVPLEGRETIETHQPFGLFLKFRGSGKAMTEE